MEGGAGGSALVTLTGSGTTGLFLQYEGGATITFLGGSGISTHFMSVSGFDSSAATAMFGTASTSLPSANRSTRSKVECNFAPSPEVAFLCSGFTS